MSQLAIGNEYGLNWRGTYNVRALSWKEGREILRRTLKTKDQLGYIEELVVETVMLPTGRPLTRAELDEIPSGLMRRLMDETLKLNDVAREEANFLQSSPTEAQPKSQTVSSSTSTT